MFRDLKLGKKISLGFGVVLILLVLVLALCIAALDRANTGIAEYRELARDTNLTGRVQANMLMVRMNVKDYLITKSDKDLQQYQDYLVRMNDFLKEAKNEIQKPERAALIAEISKNIVTYQNAFEDVVKLIKQRDELHNNQLVPAGQQMVNAITALIDLAYQRGDSEVVYRAGHVQEKMLLGRLFVAKFLHTNHKQDFDAAIENMAVNLKTQQEGLKDYSLSLEQKQLLVEFEKAHTRYIQTMHDLQELISKRNGTITNTLDMIGPEVAKAIEDVKLSVMKDQDMLGPELKRNTDQSVMLTSILSLLAVALGIGIAYFLTVSITRPIKKAVEAANLLAKGDLTVNVGKTSKDETGILLEAVQNTATNLKDMLQTISGASNELASASEELAIVTETSSQGIARQEEETEMVATAMYEMTTTVHDVADNAANAAQATSRANDEALTGSKVVADTISSINTLSHNVNSSSEKLSKVQQEVINISTILDVIKDIADQTNLLALNAAIEAARAGEQGRGFAVVADEVRSLAARTQDSTSDIQKIIEQLQAGTQNTVDVMSKSKEQADSCIVQAQQTNAALEAITSVVGVINDMNMQIASAAEQQSSVAESINESVVNVKQVAEENAVAASQIRSSSSEIARLAEQLNGLVLKFKV